MDLGKNNAYEINNTYKFKELTIENHKIEELIDSEMVIIEELTIENHKIEKLIDSEMVFIKQLTSCINVIADENLKFTSTIDTFINDIFDLVLNKEQNDVFYVTDNNFQKLRDITLNFATNILPKKLQYSPLDDIIESHQVLSFPFIMVLILIIATICNVMSTKEHYPVAKKAHILFSLFQVLLIVDGPAYQAIVTDLTSNNGGLIDLHTPISRANQSFDFLSKFYIPNNFHKSVIDNKCPPPDTISSINKKIYSKEDAWVAVHETIQKNYDTVEMKQFLDDNMNSNMKPNNYLPNFPNILNKKDEASDDWKTLSSSTASTDKGNFIVQTAKKWYLKRNLNCGNLKIKPSMFSISDLNSWLLPNASPYILYTIYDTGDTGRKIKEYVNQTHLVDTVHSILLNDKKEEKFITIVANLMITPMTRDLIESWEFFLNTDTFMYMKQFIELNHIVDIPKCDEKGISCDEFKNTYNPNEPNNVLTNYFRFILEIMTSCLLYKCKFMCFLCYNKESDDLFNKAKMLSFLSLEALKMILSCKLRQSTTTPTPNQHTNQILTLNQRIKQLFTRAVLEMSFFLVTFPLRLPSNFIPINNFLPQTLSIEYYIEQICMTFFYPSRLHDKIFREQIDFIKETALHKSDHFYIANKIIPNAFNAVSLYKSAIIIAPICYNLILDVILSFTESCTESCQKLYKAVTLNERFKKLYKAVTLNERFKKILKKKQELKENKNKMVKSLI